MGIFDMFSSTKSYHDLYCNELEQKISNQSKNEYVILDVRTAGEFTEGHIPGAINVNVMDPSFASKVDKMDKNKDFYVICRSGGRSGSACGQMSKMGFTKVHNLVGGMMGWQGKVV